MPSGRPERRSGEFDTQVRGMFDRIAGVYDLMNQAMTAGLHHRWRARLVDRLEPYAGERALDVCCGTGDLALELCGRLGPEGEVVGSDFSERMLEVARSKPVPRQDAPVAFEWGDALELPYDDESFDIATVGFGVRNLADLERGLAELARVLRPGGRLGILEITQPRRPPLSWFFAMWFDRLVPVLGRLAGDSDAYSYLPDSVKRFPSPERLAEMLDEAGFERIRYAITAGGVIALHSGVRGGRAA